MKNIISVVNKSFLNKYHHSTWFREQIVILDTFIMWKRILIKNCTVAQERIQSKTNIKVHTVFFLDICDIEFSIKSDQNTWIRNRHNLSLWWTTHSIDCVSSRERANLIKLIKKKNSYFWFAQVLDDCNINLLCYSLWLERHLAVYSANYHYIPVNNYVEII